MRTMMRTRGKPNTFSISSMISQAEGIEVIGIPHGNGTASMARQNAAYACFGPLWQSPFRHHHARFATIRTRGFPSIALADR
jgi:hypothetical protein